MPLSEHENHLLQDIERSLSLQDPDLASRLRSGRSVGGLRRSWVVLGAAALLGLVLTVIGVSLKNAVGIVVAVVGYVILVLSVNDMVGAVQRTRAGRR
jgi:hypothetical protein